MATLPQAPRISLSAAEREVVVVFNDAAQTWTIYSDSRSLGGMIRKLARSLGVDARRVGDHGVEFAVPADALRLTARRRGGGRGRPFASPKSAGPAAVEGKAAILVGD